MDLDHPDIIYLKELGKAKKTVYILTCVDMFVSLAGAGTVMPGKKRDSILPMYNITTKRWYISICVCPSITVL